MNAKERFYSGLAKETIGKITSNTDNWTSFLRTMSRNYEFTYPEQVMIYAQRPNATFCKPYEDWNAENYRRYVKRGSTGIALFVMNRDKPYLRYVFDVADTGVRRSSPELKPWEVTPENRSYVMEAMERTFGVAADGVLEAQLEDIASALAAEYWDDYKKQFLDIVANSFLEEYDELNIEVAFKNAVANSVSYTMYCRFVESPDNYFEHEDFQKVFDFNTRQTVNQHTLKFASKSYFHNFFHLGIIQAGESYNVYLECNQNKTIVLDINSMELGVSDFRRHYKFVVKYQQPKQFLLVMHQLFL